MHSSHSPSMVVNIASVRCGRPESRTTRMARATASLTEPVSSAATAGATEKAINMPNTVCRSRGSAPEHPRKTRHRRLRTQRSFLRKSASSMIWKPRSWLICTICVFCSSFIVRMLVRPRGHPGELVKVGDLDRHPEPVAPVLGLHERAPLEGGLRVAGRGCRCRCRPRQLRCAGGGDSGEQGEPDRGLEVESLLVVLRRGRLGLEVDVAGRGVEDDPVLRITDALTQRIRHTSGVDRDLVAWLPSR